MLNFKSIVIHDGLSDTEIAERIIAADAAMIVDGRLKPISKPLDEIVKEYYRKQDERTKEEARIAKQQNPFATIPVAEHRPAEIKITE
jgi:hypothetical protein